MPVTMIAFLIGSLSVIGLPPFGGSWSKWYLIMGAVSAGHVIVVAVLMVSSLLNIAYLIPVVIRAFFAGPSANSPGETKIKEAPLFCLIPLCITAAGCLILFFFANDLYRFLTAIVQN
jgi:multicomponent Na+:H+ antiporter subunit D